MISIKCLNKKGLEEFIASKKYGEMPHLPISKHRAISHINNPRADIDDTLLLLAYADEQMVGYLGVLPDLISYNNKPEKCGWLSCLWIDNQQRGKQIAFKLVTKALEVWNQRILVTEYTVPARRLYNKTQSFQSLASNQGLRLYVRSNLNELLAPKKEVYKKLQPFIKMIDKGFNTFLDIRFKSHSKALKDCIIEPITQIDEELSAFIEARQENQLFKRDAIELNWILDNPWVLTKPEDAQSKKYYFSSVAERFEFEPLLIRNKENQLIAFILFARRNDDLKIPYCYGEDIETIAKVVKHHLVKWRIKTCTLFHPKLVAKLRKGNTPALYKKSIYRNYIISNFFTKKNLPANFEIQDGDADCSFT